MKLTKLTLLNFRNYGKVNILFNSGMNVFIGNNAQGKTNILESIYILALTKSHRVGTNQNIIKFNKSRTNIKGLVEKNGILNKLEISLSKDCKDIYFNSSKINRLADYISNLNVIVFTPDDLDIIKGSPNIRRNLLNTEISQISKIYLTTYNEYNKLLKVRNEYLKILFNNSMADKKYLDVITNKLIEKSIIIYKKRNDFIKMINEKINYYYKFISNSEGVKIVYKPNIEIKNFTDEEIYNTLKIQFEKNYLKELSNGVTLYGPHRDDFCFLLDDIDIKFFGSQGQQRLSVLCLKLSEIDIFTNINGTEPLLLLDDIFSEFDLKKKNNILKIISNGNFQSILTTTDIKNINKKYLNNSYIYEVKQGIIERK